MAYVVLARKLRPTQFDDLVGQSTIAQILKNAIINNRVAHAFLFTGSRGVGKTSAARILTKAINCLAPNGANPCNTCENCQEISDNASPDVYEIDAASNRGIDNIRELRENVKYAPARCRYKVYIIDEAHMLTTESFNALLKTLEEPPPHVKFILATTDPHKIPQTIVSRCQRYDFTRIPLREIVNYLENVIRQENIQLSGKSMEMIARQAVGGMRDALTAVDQILSYAGASASDEEVAQILGMVDSNARFKFLRYLLKKNAPEAIRQFYVLQEHGHDFQDLLTELLQATKTLSLVQTLGAEPQFFENVPEDELKEYQQLSQEISTDEIQQIFYILLELEERLKRSTHAQICFEMAILQITSVHPLIGLPELLEQIQTLRKGNSPHTPVSPNLSTISPVTPSLETPPPAPKNNIHSPEPSSPPIPQQIPREEHSPEPFSPPIPQQIPREEHSPEPSSSPIPQQIPREEPKPLISEEKFIGHNLSSDSETAEQSSYTNKTTSPSPTDEEMITSDLQSRVALIRQTLSQNDKSSHASSLETDKNDKTLPTTPTLQKKNETHDESRSFQPDDETPHSYPQKPYSVENNTENTVAEPEAETFQASPPPLSEKSLASQTNGSTKSLAELSEDEMQMPPDQWLFFVDAVQQKSAKIGGLMKNAIPCNITENELEIGFRSEQFTHMLSSDDRKLIEQVANEFFESPMQVLFRKMPVSSPILSASERQQILHDREIKQKKEAARTHPQVENILNVFNNSQIIDIEIDEA